MEFRHLGRSGLMVSEIAYGNWITHGSQIDEDRARACVRAALDMGITTFDTADAYAEGRAEEVLGRALRTERRDEIEIFTKVYWPTGAGRNNRGLNRKHILRSADNSLRRLGTDYIDLYQAHRHDYSTPLEETLRAFDDLVRQGKVLYVGVSEWTAPEIAEALGVARDMGLDRIVSNQPQYNMLRRVIEPEIVPLCEREGVGQVIFQPMAMGVLTGKYPPGAPAPSGSRATDPEGGQYVARLLTDDILTRVQNLRPLAADHGLTLAQLSIAWTLANPNVSSAIVGASRPEQITDSAAAAGVRLGPDALKAIDETLGDVIERHLTSPLSPQSRP
ncbi:aldo/keto reductase family protein [Nonomuraea sp. NPDC050394]|uniref:aldo/keto reductase family protein n=1 Tax=Nonomuraea sp. NPDC050394 TaxID=3364363 RepID=UPI003788546C